MPTPPVGPLRRSPLFARRCEHGTRNGGNRSSWGSRELDLRGVERAGDAEIELFGVREVRPLLRRGEPVVDLDRRGVRREIFEQDARRVALEVERGRDVRIA